MPRMWRLICMKCAKVLSNIENVCWVCNSPIDETKPIIPQDDEVEKRAEEMGKNKPSPK